MPSELLDVSMMKRKSHFDWSSDMVTVYFVMSRMFNFIKDNYSREIFSP